MPGLEVEARENIYVNGGEGEIRTPDSLATMSDFESGAFNRALPPLRVFNCSLPTKPQRLKRFCLALTACWQLPFPLWRDKHLGFQKTLMVDNLKGPSHDHFIGNEHWLQCQMEIAGRNSSGLALGDSLRG